MSSPTKPTVTRRSFLKQASLATAAIAPTIIPASALGLGNTVAPSNRIVMGAIGVGSRGSGITMGAVQQKDTQLVAVCDINRPKVEKFKEKIDQTYDNTDCTVYDDFRELLARDDIDALTIAPPDHWHAIPCIAAANAKMDIYCEKPLTRTLEEGRHVVDAVKRNNIILQVGSMQRADNRMKQACELVRNGYLGKIKHINVGLPDGGHQSYVSDFPDVPEGIDYKMWIGPAKFIPYHPNRMDWNWRWWMGIGGGQLLDWIGHHGDIAHMGMGWDDRGPISVEGENWSFIEDRTKRKLQNLYNDPFSYRSKLTYKEGVTMTIGSINVMPKAFSVGDGHGTQWIGENGDWVFVSRSTIAASDEKLLDIKMGSNDFRFREERNHMRDFLDCVKSRKDPAATVTAGHRSASIGHISRIACVLGEKLEWDEHAEKFTNSSKANKMLSDKDRNGWKLG